MPSRMGPMEARQQIRILQAASFEDKIERAREIIKAAIRTGAPVVSFSGGRDSVAMAHLARELAPDIPFAHVDTGLEDPRLTAWIREFGGANVRYAEPPANPHDTWQAGGPLPIGAKMSFKGYQRMTPGIRVDPARCCQIHKARPMRPLLKSLGCTALLFGALASDSKRHLFKLMSGEMFKAKDDPWQLAYPMLTWTKADVAEYVRRRVPEFTLQYAKAEELGCRACAIDLPYGVNQMVVLKERDPDYHRYLLIDCGFGEQILAIRYGLTIGGARAVIERDGWDALIEKGAFDLIPQPRKGLT